MTMQVSLLEIRWEASERGGAIRRKHCFTAGINSIGIYFHLEGTSRACL